MNTFKKMTELNYDLLRIARYFCKPQHSEKFMSMFHSEANRPKLTIGVVGEPKGNGIYDGVVCGSVEVGGVRKTTFAVDVTVKLLDDDINLI